MSKMIGYMVTWTTYGSWLQGDGRGYVRHGETVPGDQRLVRANLRHQKSQTVRLSSNEKAIIRQAILNEAARIGHRIEALAVCTYHVHLVARPGRESIEQIVSRYKNVAMFALCNRGRARRIWTRGFDKRFCFSEEDVNRRIAYVKRHESD
jgi:REP element-mobilizing transposase RayT